MSIENDSVRGSCVSRDEVLRRVRRIVGEQTGMSAEQTEQIRETDLLENDLACDSLDVTEIAMEVEEEFDIAIPDDAAQDNRSVGQIVDGVLRLLGQPDAE